LPERNSYVLDSYALIGYLEGEAFANQIEDILLRARHGECQLYLHVLHLGEVYYITLREKGEETARLAYDRIKSFPLVLIENINHKLLLAAATFKAHHPISYADSFAAALAKINNSFLLTGDPEFKILEDKGVIRIEWLEGKGETGLNID